MICGAAVLLAFAEEVFARVICGAAVISAFAEEVSVCQVRVSYNDFIKAWPTRV